MKCGTVAILGPPNAGKSTFLNALLGQKIVAVSHKPQTSRRNVRGILTRDDTQFVFIDTPGILAPKDALQRTLYKNTQAAMSSVDAFVFMVGLSQKGSELRIRFDDEAKLFFRRCNEKKKPIFFVINKVDLAKNKDALLPLLAEFSKQVTDLKTPFFISALKKEGLEFLLENIEEALPESAHFFSSGELSDLSEKEIVRELVFEKVIQYLHKEIPYGVEVFVESFDESRRDDPVKPLVSLEVQIQVKREGYKRIILGKNGIQIKAIGQAARIELERLLGCKVMLTLFVKVMKK